MGHRIAKHVLSSSNVLEKSTYYILDAQGNVMSTYVREIISSTVYYSQKERYIYGSSRLGVMNDSLPLYGSQNATYSQTTWTHGIGKRNYELSNHLGNVLSVVSDKPIAHGSGVFTGTPSLEVVDYFQADILQSTDYSAFGVQLNERSLKKTGLNRKTRFGFNGMEMDNEIHPGSDGLAEGDSYDFGARMLDPRLGRWLSLDPKSASYPDCTPYSYASNSPIFNIDNNGEAAYAYYDAVRGVIVISSQIIVYTGSKSVFTELNPNDIKNSIESQFNNVIVQNSDGTISEVQPSVMIGNREIPVILEVSVNVIYSEKFNSDNFEEINSGFESANHQYKTSNGVDAPGEGELIGPMSNNHSNEFFFRIESNENYSELSKFYVDGNSGMGRMSQCYQNGKPTTTISHEFLFHGLCGIFDHPPKFDKGHFGQYDPLGTPAAGYSATGCNTYLDGTDTDPTIRRLFKFEFDQIDWTGFDLTKYTGMDQSGKRFTIGRSTLTSTGDQLIMNKNGKGADGY